MAEIQGINPHHFRSNAAAESQARQLLLLSASLFLITGCAHGLLQPLPVIPESIAAKITVLRDPEFMGIGMHYIIAVDGKEIFVLWTGEHATIPITPGDRVISARCSGLQQWITAEASIHIRIEPGDHYYFWVYPAPGKCANILQSTKGAAEEHMKRMRLLELE